MRPISMAVLSHSPKAKPPLAPNGPKAGYRASKPTFDMAATEGLNRLLWHEFISSPALEGLPGQDLPLVPISIPTSHGGGQVAACLRYLNRVEFLLRQGTPVDDLLYFYGDNVPAFARLKASDPAKVLPGFDYDVTGEDALLHHQIHRQWTT